MNTTTGDRRFYVSLCNACEIKPEALVLMLRILDLCATGKASEREDVSLQFVSHANNVSSNC